MNNISQPAKTLLKRFSLAFSTDSGYVAGMKHIPQKYLSPKNTKIKPYKDELTNLGILTSNNWYKRPEINGKKGICMTYALDWAKVDEFILSEGEGNFVDGFFKIFKSEGEPVEGFSIDLKSAINDVFKTINVNYIKNLCKDVKLENGGFKIGLDIKPAIQIVFPGSSNIYTITPEAYQTGNFFIKQYKDKFIGFNSGKDFTDWCKDKTIQLKIKHCQHAFNNKTPKYYYKFGESTNYREYTTITNLPSYLKKHLTINNNKTTQTDITNAQPTLLINLFLSRNIESTNYVSDEEIELLMDLATHGRFYEYVWKKGGLNTRKEAKLMTFQVLYDKTRDNESNRLFNRLFPGLMAFVNDFKARHGYKKLSVSLQIMEAKMMEQVQNRLREAGYTVTGVHDSVICEARYEKEVYEIMVAEMKNHIEYFNV